MTARQGFALALLALVGVGALSLAWQNREVIVGTIGGWRTKYVSVALRMTDAQKAFMERVRALVPAQIPLVVTSSYRTPQEQAQVLIQKLQAGASLEEIRKLYGGSAPVTEMLSVPTSAWAQIIQAQVARGTYLSSHLKQGALDLSVHAADGIAYLPLDQQQAIVTACKAAGARVAFIEAHPPHIHVEIA